MKGRKHIIRFNYTKINELLRTPNPKVNSRLPRMIQDKKCSEIIRHVKSQTTIKINPVYLTGANDKQ